MQLRLLFLRPRVGLHSRVDLSTRTDRPLTTDRGSQGASASHRSARDMAASVSRFPAPASGRRDDRSTAASALADLPAAATDRATGPSATGGSNYRATNCATAAGLSTRPGSTCLELGTQNGAATSPATESSVRLRSLRLADSTGMPIEESQPQNVNSVRVPV